MEIIFRRVAGEPRPVRDPEPDPAPPPLAPEAAPARRRGLGGRAAALALSACALLAFLVAALASGDRTAAPSPRTATPPPADAPAPPPAAVADAEPAGPSPAAGDPGEAAVRAFYEALGRGDGAAASARVVPEKRGSRAFSPRAITRFYGALPEPLRLLSVTPLAPGSYRVRYRYSAGRVPCDGEAVVTVASRDGDALVGAIRALDGC